MARWRGRIGIPAVRLDTLGLEWDGRSLAELREMLSAPSTVEEAKPC